MKRTAPNREAYDAGNAQAARLYLSDPGRFGPAMVAWAQLWQKNHPKEAATNAIAKPPAVAGADMKAQGEERPPTRKAQGSLFD